MSNWWEICSAEQFDIPSRKAVAYYRHSAQDRQENSIPIQQEQVQQWAEQIGIKIIHEFADAGKSGLNAEGRPAFTEMMEEWVKKRNDFMYILCLDVTRWGRFQDIDLSVQYSAECQKYGKPGLRGLKFGDEINTFPLSLLTARIYLELRRDAEGAPGLSRMAGPAI